MSWKKRLIPTVGVWCMVQFFLLLMLFHCVKGGWGENTAIGVNLFSMLVPLLIGLIIKATLLRERPITPCISMTFCCALLSLSIPLITVGNILLRIVIIFFSLVVGGYAFGGYDQEDFPLGSRTPMWGLKQEEIEPSDTPIVIKD